jgi:outer membrane protein assembly factor BamB
MVYASSEDHNVYALDASTGALVWKYPTGDVMLGSPTVANGVLYVGSNDNNVYALDAKTGAKLWTYATAGVVQDIGGPTVADGVVYVTSGTIGGRNNVYAFSLPYGERLSRKTQQPNPKTLQPDYNLKFSQPVAKLPAGGE